LAATIAHNNIGYAMQTFLLHC